MQARECALLILGQSSASRRKTAIYLRSTNNIETREMKESLFADARAGLAGAADASPKPRKAISGSWIEQMRGCLVQAKEEECER